MPTYTAATATQRAQLSASVSDPDGGTVRAAFTISRRSVGAITWEVMVDKAEGSAVSSGQSSVRSVDFIAGYEYQVTAWGYDGRRFSAASSASITFTVTATAGFGDVPATNDNHAAGLGAVLGLSEGTVTRREGGLR